jgi:hypothetical protein
MLAVSFTADGLQKGPLDEVLFVKDILEIIQVLLVRLGQLYAQDLFGVVPFVYRRVGVEAFITLLSNETAVQSLAQNLGQFSIAYPCFTLEEQRFFHLEGQVNDGGKLAIANVILFLEGPGYRINGSKGFFIATTRRSYCKLFLRHGTRSHLITTPSSPHLCK